MLFPGQGSQKSGMGRPWEGCASWHLVASLSEASGYDLEALLLEADDETLRRTDNAQLSTFALEGVIFSELLAAGIGKDQVAGCAGHSLGEYSAVAASGASEFADLSPAVVVRAKSMAQAAQANPGTMAAVMASADDTLGVISQCGSSQVWLANLNAETQSVISGTKEGVEAAMEAAKGAGFKVLSFPVGGAFHTPLMASAREPLAQALEAVAWGKPKFPVVTNVGAEVVDSEWDWKTTLGDQLVSPVRWYESTEALVTKLGATTLVEAGPGKVLTGLAKRAHPGAHLFNLACPEDVGRLAEHVSV